MQFRWSGHHILLEYETELVGDEKEIAEFFLEEKGKKQKSLTNGQYFFISENWTIETK